MNINSVSNEWLDITCSRIIRDMNNCGICVLDNFLGTPRGDLILDEVKSMYQYGIFQDGQLVRQDNRIPNPSQLIRGDKIIWINGGETNCINIRFLIQTLDTVIARCNKMQNNGLFSKYNISSRTNAMIACYPGNGSQYVKHIDNPNGDGRIITCIYYLNKDWNYERDGGLLRLYPSFNGNQIAEVPPIFDRVIFFWSDRRNPHEVTPSASMRLAITVWYFDDEERNQAIQRNNYFNP
ncbi:HIF prolyl hydroxylase [Brevipalpus obovatus]|uniref:HIF prolyl hydroxylase n=1 Tax=Brevipalpus obovatus TaxID=246614 RepID=UPI003D9F8E68